MDLIYALNRQSFFLKQKKEFDKDGPVVFEDGGAA